MCAKSVVILFVPHRLRLLNAAAAHSQIAFNALIRVASMVRQPRVSQRKLPGQLASECGSSGSMDVGCGNGAARAYTTCSRPPPNHSICCQERPDRLRFSMFERLGHRRRKCPSMLFKFVDYVDHHRMPNNPRNRSSISVPGRAGGADLDLDWEGFPTQDPTRRGGDASGKILSHS